MRLCFRPRPAREVPYNLRSSLLGGASDLEAETVLQELGPGSAIIIHNDHTPHDTYESG